MSVGGEVAEVFADEGEGGVAWGAFDIGNEAIELFNSVFVSDVAADGVYGIGRIGNQFSLF